MFKSLFKRQLSDEIGETRTISLVLKLSFETSVQVSFKDGTGRLRLKRFRGKSWQEAMDLTIGPLNEIHFKAFVHSPHLEKDQQLTLAVYADGGLLQQADFIISKDKDFAGWFSLHHSFDK